LLFRSCYRYAFRRVPIQSLTMARRFTTEKGNPFTTENGFPQNFPFPGENVEYSVHDSLEPQENADLPDENPPEGGARTASAYQLKRRWYSTASVVKKGKEWAVQLDGKPIITPGQHTVLLPSEELAYLIAAEWESQGEKIRPILMPLMTLSATVLDVIPGKRTMIIKNLLAFLNTDVLVTRSPEESKLFQLQIKEHDPILNWFRGKFNVPINTCGEAYKTLTQPESTMHTIQWLLFDLSDWDLAAFNAITQCTKSLLIPLAIRYNFIDTQHAVRISRLEEMHQAAGWGFVEDRHDVDQADVSLRVGAASLMLYLNKKNKK